MRSRSILSTVNAARLSARYLQTTAPLPPPTTPLPPPEPIASSSASPVASSSKSQLPYDQIRSAAISHLPPIQPRSTAPPTLPTTIPDAVSLLKSQSTSSSGIYLVARLHSRTFLLHPRDILTLPNLKPLQPPGTTLKLTRILEVGSRDFAIRAPSADAKILRKQMDWDARTLPNIPTELVNCELTIIEHTKSPMETRFKMKRRIGYRKSIRAKHGWTRLRVGDIHLASNIASEEEELEVGTPSSTIDLERGEHSDSDFAPEGVEFGTPSPIEEAERGELLASDVASEGVEAEMPSSTGEAERGESPASNVAPEGGEVETSSSTGQVERGGSQA